MFRVGHGFDLHRTGPGETVILGGVRLSCGFSLIGHSDADVLVHAVIDAILGACGLGDIGRWFPDTDDAFRDADSCGLLRTVMTDPRVGDWRIVNIDTTILAERPRLATCIPDMQSTLAAACACPPDRVSVKAKTFEGLGDIGRGDAIAAHAVVLLGRAKQDTEVDASTR